MAYSMKASYNKQQRHFFPQFIKSIPQTLHCGVLNAFLVCPLWLGWCVRLAGLVPGLAPHLVSACLASGLNCCVRLPGLEFLLSPALSSIWSGTGLVFFLSPVLSPSLAVLSPSLSPIWSELPLWACLSLVSGLVSQLVSGLVSQLFCLCLLACV